jgi:hydrogenase maturation factor
MEQLNNNIEQVLREQQLDSKGLVLLKRFLVSGPGCEFDRRLMELKGPINLAQVHELNPTGAAITLFSWGEHQEISSYGEREVILAFASKEHAQASWDAVNSPFFRKIRADEGFDQIEEHKERYLFSDMANPVEIRSVDGQKVEAIYHNGGIEVQIKNVFSKDSVQVGDHVLIHLGSVVHQFQPRENLLISEILRVQRKTPEIMHHYEKIDQAEIDYEQDFGASVFEYNQVRCGEFIQD